MRATFLATLLIGAATLGSVAAAQEEDVVATVGAKPAFTFAAPLDNGFGVTSLQSLQGAPTLVEFWGTY